MPEKFGNCNDCSLTASPAVINEGDWVTLELQGMSYGQPTDWIGAFAPEDITPTGQMLAFPVRWQFADTTCVPRTKNPPANATCVGLACCYKNDYEKDGKARIGMQLANLRSDYVFVLVQESAQFPLISAVSKPVSFKTPLEPLQIHLALTQKSAEMRVTWTSGPVSSPAQVRWGTSPGNFTESTAAVASTYQASDMCSVQGSGPAATMGFRDPGTIYTAVMADLVPGVTYYYTVGSDDAKSGWSHAHAHDRRRSSTAHAAADATADATAKAAPGGALSFLGPPAPGGGYGGDGLGVSFSTFGDMGKQASAWDGSLEHSWDNAPGLGEIGSWNTSSLLEREVLEGNTTMVLHIGDIAYSVGYSSEWDEFMAQIEPVSARVPWMAGIGNHEMNCPCAAGDAELRWLNGSDSGGECGVPYNARFLMPPHSATPLVRADGGGARGATAPTPTPPPPHGSGGTPWYAFVYGPVFIVVMSTEHDFKTGSRQMADLQRYLANVDRAVTPWVVFTGHRPMYVSSRYPSDEHEPMVKYIEPLLLEHNVDLALWGHHHSYQRSCPMANGVCVKAPGAGAGAGTGTGAGAGVGAVGAGTGVKNTTHAGVVHAVIGVAGYEFSPVATGADKPSWVEYQECDRYGYARIHADAAVLQFSFVDTGTGVVVDGVTLASKY
jgi:hypothetical protein